MPLLPGPEGRQSPGLNWYRANLPPQTLPGTDEPRLPPVQVETLRLFGADDPYLSERAMTASAASVTPGRWRYERLNGAGRWLQLEQPERVNDLLLDFLGV